MRVLHSGKFFAVSPRKKMTKVPKPACHLQYYRRAGKPVKCTHVAGDSAHHYLAIRARNMEERLQDSGRHRVNQPCTHLNRPRSCKLFRLLIAPSPVTAETAPLDYWQFGERRGRAPRHHSPADLLVSSTGFPSTQEVENFNARARFRNAKK